MKPFIALGSVTLTLICAAALARAPLVAPPRAQEAGVAVMEEPLSDSAADPDPTPYGQSFPDQPVGD